MNLKLRVIAIALLGATVLAACDSAAVSPSQQGERGERRAGFRAACGADMQAYCANVSREQRRECIAANKEKFSQGCKTYMEQNPWRGRRDRQG